MTPIDFIRGGDHYNDPVGKYQESLDKEIVIVSTKGEWQILSYYLLPTGQMCLDIERKK